MKKIVSCLNWSSVPAILNSSDSLYITRHTHSYQQDKVLNKDGLIYSGQEGDPLDRLTELGRSEAIAMAEMLYSRLSTGAYSSLRIICGPVVGAQRTVETAEIIRSRLVEMGIESVEITHCLEFTEIKTGAAGKPKSDVMKAMKPMFEGDVAYIPPQGESVNHFLFRLHKAFNSISIPQKNEAILLVMTRFGLTCLESSGWFQRAIDGTQILSKLDAIEKLPGAIYQLGSDGASLNLLSNSTEQPDSNVSKKSIL